MNQVRKWWNRSLYKGMYLLFRQNQTLKQRIRLQDYEISLLKGMIDFLEKGEKSA